MLCKSYIRLLSVGVGVSEKMMIHSITAYLQKPRLINILRGVSRPAVYTPILAPESKCARHSTVLVWEEGKTNETSVER